MKGKYTLPRMGPNFTGVLSAVPMNFLPSRKRKFMTTYSVVFEATAVARIDVQASNEDEAEKLAAEKFDEYEDAIHKAVENTAVTDIHPFEIEDVEAL